MIMYRLKESDYWEDRRMKYIQTLTCLSRKARTFDFNDTALMLSSLTRFKKISKCNGCHGYHISFQLPPYAPLYSLHTEVYAYIAARRQELIPSSG